MTVRRLQLCPNLLCDSLLITAAPDCSRTNGRYGMVGRGAGVGRNLGLGVILGIALGEGVAVAVAFGLGVGVV